MEQALPTPASWTGLEWFRKEETKTEPDTEADVTSFDISGSGVSGLDSTFTKSSDTYNDKPVYTNTSNMYCWWYSNKWCITAKTGNMSTVYAHSDATSPENPWDVTTWYGTWFNENQLTNMVVTADFPTKEVTTVVYKKATTITEGLSWTAVKPEVGKTYTEDALVEIASLYQSEDNGGTGEPDVPAPDEPEEPEEPDTPTPNEPEVSFGRVVTLSGVGSLGYDSVELDYGADVAMNGDYTLVDATATGKNRVWTMYAAANGITYAIKHDGDRTWRVDNYNTDENILYCENSSYDSPWINETTSITWWAGPNDCPHIKTLPKADSSSEPELPTPDKPEVDVAFTVAGCSVEELNGDWIEESSNVYINADDSTKKCTMDDGPDLWHFWSTVTDVTLVYTTDSKDNPWEIEWWYNMDDNTETQMTVTKAGSQEDSSSSSSSDGDYVVSGAGSTQFNGTYEKIEETYEGETLYVNENGCVLWQYVNGGGARWYMNDTLDNLRDFGGAASFYGSDTSDVTGTWMVNAGDDPAPTVIVTKSN